MVCIVRLKCGFMDEYKEDVVMSLDEMAFYMEQGILVEAEYDEEAED